MDLKWLLLICLQCCTLPRLEAQNSLQQAAQRLAQDPALAEGFLSFTVARARDGKVFCAYQSDKQMNMASNAKLITTATALAMLGEGFRFQTRLAYSGQIEEGILKGNLYIIGGGDPSLGSSRIGSSLEAVLAKFTSEIQKLGIREVQGAVLADAGIFNRNVYPAAWIWGDIGNYYGAAAFGLNIAENSYQLFLEPGKQIGAPAKVLRTEPAMPEILFHNQLLTAAANSGDQAYIDGAAYSFERYLHGTIPLGGTFSIKGALPHPPLQLAQWLTERLQKTHISVQAAAVEGKASERGDSLQIFYRHESPALGSIIEYINLYSVNLYAESLFKYLEYTFGKKSSELIKTFWKSKNVALDKARLEDGSGLAPSGHCSTAQMVAMLNQMSREKYFEVFLKSLPVAGQSGTLRTMGKGTALQGRLQAKSGWMQGNIAFSGYFKNNKGELMSFSVAANRFDASYATMRGKIEVLLLQMLDTHYPD